MLFTECKYGEDENFCTWSWAYTVNFLLIAYLIVTVSWCFTYFMVFASLKKDTTKSHDEILSKYMKKDSCQIIIKRQLSEELKEENFLKLTGDDLAYLKVSNSSANPIQKLKDKNYYQSA